MTEHKFDAPVAIGPGELLISSVDLETGKAVGVAVPEWAVIAIQREAYEDAAKIAEEEATLRRNQIDASKSLSNYMLEILVARGNTAAEIATAIRARAKEQAKG